MHRSGKQTNLQNTSAFDLRTTLGSLLLLRKLVLLWVLSDQSLGLCVHGGRSSGQTRWFDKYTVAWWATEVHSSLDSPIVLSYGRVSNNWFRDLQ